MADHPGLSGPFDPATQRARRISAQIRRPRWWYERLANVALSSGIQARMVFDLLMG